MPVIGKYIKLRREELGLTQEELAKRLGYKSKTTIAKIESGVNDIVQSKVIEFANALETSPAYLMGWEDVLLNRDNPYSKISNTSKKEPFDISKDPNYIGSYSLDHVKKIPLLGYISAGLPIYADEHLEGYIYTDLNGGAEYFALRVSGDSMNAARICDGDVVIVRVQPSVENGEIAVVLVDNENATVKRFYQSENSITLMPQSSNPKHQMQQYDLKSTPIKVLGKVVKVEFVL